MSGHKEHHASHSASKAKMRAESSGGKKKTHADKQCVLSNPRISCPLCPRLRRNLPRRGPPSARG